MGIFDELTAKKEEIDKNKIVFEGRLMQAMQIDFIFTSSNFEGIVLSQAEAEQVVKDSDLEIPLANKNLLQAKGQKVVLDYIEDFIRQDQKIDIYLIKDFHKKLFAKAWPDIAGQWRQESVRFKLTKYLPPHHSKIPEEMYLFDKFLLKEQDYLNGDLRMILEFAAKVFHEFTRIHPFRDGNGRTARFLFNVILRKYGLPYVIIPKAGKTEDFLRALEAADFGDSQKLTEIMAGYLLNSFDFVLRFR